ncbi:MAG: NAD(P)-dependent oxidoreductase [Verrucomicrobiaceae bacterium]|nr:MAG: NAD(P)-dependent oxidoreductase [Verrucomicrobiaceae bacterium]
MSGMPTIQRAAVLGLGIIGSRALARLREAGWQVAAWNRTPKGLPGEAATAEEAIHGAQVISIYLKDRAAVRGVVEHISPHLTEGQIVLNHATVDLETTQWLAEHCAERGARFLDTPFTGSKNASAGGQLVYYTGGDPALVAEVEPYLMVTGKSLLPCGGIGSATVVKLATNLISACTVQALAEAMAISVKHGVSADDFQRAVALNAHASGLSAMKLPGMATGDFDTHFSMANMWKDSSYAVTLAEQAGLDAPAIRSVSGRMKELCDEGLADLDFSALAKPYLHPDL